MKKLLPLAMASLIACSEPPLQDEQGAESVLNSDSLIPDDPIGMDEWDGTTVNAYLLPEDDWYHFLQRNDDGFFYEEPASFEHRTIQISETAEGSGEWTLDYMGDWYGIWSVEEVDLGLQLNCTHYSTGGEETFFFHTTDQEKVWGFNALGNVDMSYVVARQYLEDFLIVPNTDATAIGAELNYGWVYLTPYEEGGYYIYEHCMYGYDALNIDLPGGMLWFSGGGDAYEYLIRSVEKSNNRVTIEYARNEEVESEFMHIRNADQSHVVISFVYGDEHYVKSQYIEDYDVLYDDVDCEDF